jgi:hypothetical protein
MSRPNDLAFVREMMARPDEGGVSTWLFGGWAEELLGLIRPRAHHDVDLLHAAPDFTNADALIACKGDLAEIRQKRFASTPSSSRLWRRVTAPATTRRCAP